MFFHNYPYTDAHELNLDWIIAAIRHLEHEVADFVSINALKYADPIQWSITSQYEKNTIVIDGNTGVAYISVRPVPAGISISNTGYWTPVFDMTYFIENLGENFADNYEVNTLTATKAASTGEWIVWNDALYVALNNINVGDAYVVDGNIQRITIEDVINGIKTHYDSVIGDLADLTTTDTSSVVNAINSVKSELGTEISDRAAEDLRLQGEIDNILLSMNYADVKAYGAEGDGTTDDTQAFIDAIATGKPVFIPAGTYYLPSGLTITSAVTLIGSGDGLTILKGDNTTTVLHFIGAPNCTVARLTINTCLIAIELEQNSAWSTFTDITIQNCYSKGVYAHGEYFPTPTYDVIECNFTRVRYIVSSVVATAFHFYCVGDIWLTDCMSQVNTNTSSVCLFIDTGCSAIYVNKCNFIGSYEALRLEDANHPLSNLGGRPEMPHNIFFTQCLFDSSTYTAVIKDAFDANFIDCWFAGSANTGLQIEGQTHDMVFDSCRIHSNTGNGAWIANSTVHDIVFSACRIYDNTFSGLQLDGSNIIIIGCIIERDNYGIIFTAGIDNVIVSGTYFDNTADIIDNGATDLVIGTCLPATLNTVVNINNMMRFNNTVYEYWDGSTWSVIPNQVRYNTSLTQMEYWDGSAWTAV